MVECTHLKYISKTTFTIWFTSPQDERIHQSTTILLIAYYTQHTRRWELEESIKMALIPGVHWHNFILSTNLPVNLKLF